MRRSSIGRPDVRLVSLMDHTPGQRQFRDEGKLRDYYRGKKGGMSDAELDALFERRLEYQAAVRGTRTIAALVELARSVAARRSPATTTPRSSTSRGDPRRGGDRRVPDHGRGGARRCTQPASAC